MLLIAAVYAPVRGYPFLDYDDPDYVTENAHVAGGLTPDNIIWAWTSIHAATWHPLTSLSHMLDCQLFGLDPGAPHVENVVWHALSTLLLFAVLRRATGSRWRSAAVAALFALHPLHVESVAWIAERKDVLSGFFWMLTLWAYVGYVRRRGGWRYLLVALSFAAALLSKPMVVTLPFVLLLFDVWPLRRIDLAAAARFAPALRPLLIEKVPLLLCAGIVAAVAIITQRHVGAVVPLALTPLDERVAIALLTYGAYLHQMMWPAGLAVFYPYQLPILLPRVIGAGMVLIVITVFVWRSARQRPYLVTGWLWYVGTLVPVIGLLRIGGHSMADRYTYLPSIGIFIMAAWGVPDLLRGWAWGARAAAVAAVAVVAACFGLTSVQVRLWRDSLTLFQHALAVTRNNYVAHFNIGDALLKQGSADAALAHFLEVVRIAPDYPEAHYNAALILAQGGDLTAAKPHYEEALRLNPGFTKAHNNLGLLLAAQGDMEGALAHYTEALRLDADFAPARENLAMTLHQLGRADQAIAQYTEMVRRAPHDAGARQRLAAALAGAGRMTEALREYQEAVRLAPHPVAARYGLVTTLEHLHRPREAMAELEALLREQPDAPPVLARMAGYLATATDPQRRDGPRAVRLAEHAAELTNHRDPDVLNQLAASYAEVGRFADAVSVAEQALEQARAAGQTPLVTALSERLPHYRSGEPVREELPILLTP